MIPDLEYDAYRREVARKAVEPVEGLTSVPARKYRIGWAGSFEVEPIHYPGCTILAKPYPVQSLIEPLLRVQEVLQLRSTGFVSVPAETLHVTVADLVAGHLYAGLSEDDSGRLHERARSVLAAHGLNRWVTASICGIGAFDGVVIAIVDFESPADYDEIRRVRNAFYMDRDLAHLGVAKRFPFLGHVTLGYVEQPAPNGIAAAVEESRRLTHLRNLLAFPISEFGLSSCGFPVYPL